MGGTSVYFAVLYQTKVRQVHVFPIPSTVTYIFQGERTEKLHFTETERNVIPIKLLLRAELLRYEQ
jgi:hypothetical protein